MLDGRVLEASQVEYKPFGKPPLQREGEVWLGEVAGKGGAQGSSKSPRKLSSRTVQSRQRRLQRGSRLPPF